MRYSVHLALHKLDYILLHSQPMVPPRDHSMVVYCLYGWQWKYHIFPSKQIASTCFVAQTPRLCLYLSNLSTNLTSLNALTSKSIFALGYLLDPFLILCHTFSSLLDSSHKVWVVFITWNSSPLLSAFGTTLLRHGL